MIRDNRLSLREILVSNNQTLHRRAFLGGTASQIALAGTGQVFESASENKFDFDAPYNRFGTDCTKWDAQIRRFGKDSILAGMGISDTDFRTAPAITQALAERSKHENWGYLDMPHSFLD